MTIKRTDIVITLALLFTLSLSALAQQKQEQPAKQPEYVENSGFKGKIFEIKHGNPQAIASIISPLGSGFKGARIQPSLDPKTITVRDFPENIAAIEEAIKRLDVPSPPKTPRAASPDIEIYAHILIASNGETSGTQPLPALNDVLKQLQTALNYKNYQLLTSVVQRTKFENGSIEARGTAVLPDKTLNGKYHLTIQNVSPENKGDYSSLISLHNLQFYMEGHNEAENRPIGDTRINTRLTMRDGEKVVVGTASLRDKAVILVLTAKILK